MIPWILPISCYRTSQDELRKTIRHTTFARYLPGKSTWFPRWIDPGHGLSSLRSRVLPTESDVPTHGDRTLGKPQISSWRLWGKIYEALSKNFQIFKPFFSNQFYLYHPERLSGQPQNAAILAATFIWWAMEQSGTVLPTAKLQGGNWVNKEWKSLISYPCVPDLPILGWSNPPGSKNAGDVGGSLREEQ